MSVVDVMRTLELMKQADIRQIEQQITEAKVKAMPKKKSQKIDIRAYIKYLTRNC